MKIVKGNFPGKDNNPAPGNEAPREKSYAEMLLALTRPFTGRYPLPEDVEDKLQLAIIAWNAALSKALGFPGFDEMFAGVTREAGLGADDKEMVKTMMEAKLALFPDKMDFIRDYTLEEDEKGEMVVKVVNQSLEAFTLEAGGMDDDDFHDEDMDDASQYEEGIINRNAVTIRCTPAFWQWVAELDGGFKKPAKPRHNIYLIPETMSDKASAAYIKKHYDRIFMNELSDWVPDEGSWPAKRTYKMFSGFFEVEYNGLVTDLEDEPVLKG